MFFNKCSIEVKEFQNVPLSGFTPPNDSLTVRRVKSKTIKVIYPSIGLWIRLKHETVDFVAPIAWRIGTGSSNTKYILLTTG